MKEDNLGYMTTEEIRVNHDVICEKLRRLGESESQRYLKEKQLETFLRVMSGKKDKNTEGVGAFLAAIGFLVFWLGMVGGLIYLVYYLLV